MHQLEKLLRQKQQDLKIFHRSVLALSKIKVDNVPNGPEDIEMRSDQRVKTVKTE